MTESNRRHSACKADALPTELITRLRKMLLNQIIVVMTRLKDAKFTYFPVMTSFQTKLLYHALQVRPMYLDF
jgi:hypothetical protein